MRTIDAILFRALSRENVGDRLLCSLCVAVVAVGLVAALRLVLGLVAPHSEYAQAVVDIASVAVALVATFWLAQRAFIAWCSTWIMR